MTRRRSIFFVAAATLFAACGADTETAGPAADTSATVAPDSTTAQAPDSAATQVPDNTTTRATDTRTGESAPSGSVREMRRAVIDTLTAGYERWDALWPGFDPADHPVVVALRTDDGIVGALAINHSNADGLGVATALATDGTPFTSLHRIDEVADAVAERLAEVPNFDFHAQLGDVDSFVMMADQRDQFLDPTGDDWAATFVHELFHRFQDDGFSGDLGDQDIEGYAYTPENLRLAVLEDRALRDALTATDADDRLDAARRFAALRLTRRDADERVRLDDDQEKFEGSARAIEHLQAGDDTSFAYNGTNWADELSENVTAGSVTSDYGFGRFYASGAAIIRVSRLLGVDDVADRINAGEYPADVLISTTGVTLDAADELVADAETTYDPDGEIAPAVSAALETIDDEADPFADTGSDDVGAGGDVDLTDEQIACLDENVTSDNGLIPADVWRDCVGEE